MERKPRRRQDEPPAQIETPWGTVGAATLLIMGMAGYLSLVSYDARDIRGEWLLCKSLATTSEPNIPANNIVGPVGAYLAACAYLLFGAAAYLLPTSMVWFGVSMLVSRLRLGWRALGGLVLMMLTACGLLSVQNVLFQHEAALRDWASDNHLLNPGGGIGWMLGEKMLAAAIGPITALLFLGLGYATSLIMMTGLHPAQFIAMCRDLFDELRLRWRERERGPALAINGPGGYASSLRREAVGRGRGESDAEAGSGRLRRRGSRDVEDEYIIPGLEVAEHLGMATGSKKSRGKKAAAAEEDEMETPEQMSLDLPTKPEPKIIDSSERAPVPSDRPSLADIRRKAKEQKAAALAARANGESGASAGAMTGDFSSYELPDFDLLALPDPSIYKPVDKGALLATQETIIQTLASFNVNVTPGDITRGPTITRYEIYPEEGLRVNRITALEDDIARTTKAERINILAPIPGRDTVGIEIANADKTPVPLRELIEDPAFASGKAKLPLALGKDVYGHTIIGDLASMPHLLVAGATGSGKSVCINSIITSLLFQFTPEQLRFIMVDPKVVEMQQYNDLPHLVIPVVTDPKKTLAALNWVVTEMEARYRVFADCGVRNFDAFNKRPLPEKPAKKVPSPAAPSRGVTPAPAAKAACAVARPPAERFVVLGDALAEEDTSEEDEAARTARLIADATEGAPDLSPEELVDVENPSAAFQDTPTRRELEHSVFHAHQVKMEEGAEGEGDLNPGDPDELPPVPASTRAETVWTKDDDIYAEEEEEDDGIPDRYPYIVVIIDELADLMQTAPADIEVAICRIAQKARAAGIHLILATQTPRADVITGVIKANIPCKIAFQVSNALDSRVILDSKGAEKLVGKGDMLYLPPGSAKLMRAQGAFVNDDEVLKLVEFCKSQAKPSYIQDFKPGLDGDFGGGEGDGEAITDEDEDCYEKCLEVISQERRASTSLLQRRLRLGYTRAARMMDIMENRGIIGPGEGAKPREILVNLSDYGDPELD